MKIAVFGATGTVGQHLVKQALNAEHHVTAFTRRTENLDSLKHPMLIPYKGDVLNKAQVLEAIKGQDAVICLLGAGRKGNVRASGTANIIKAMEQENVTRLICQTSLGCGESWNNLNFFWKNIMFGWFLKEAFADHQLQEQYVKQSALDWTIIRPAAFTNGALTGSYKYGFSENDKSIKLKISRADIAHFSLQQLVPGKNNAGKAIGLSY